MKKVHSNMSCYTQEWVIHCYFKFLVFIFWNSSQKLNVEWHWLTFFEPDFLAFWSVLFLQQTSLWRTVSELDSHHRCINIEGIYKEFQAWFYSWKWWNMAWNPSSSLTIYFSILPLCGRQLPLRKTFIFILTLGKWQNAFDNMCLCKF